MSIPNLGPAEHLRARAARRSIATIFFVNGFVFASWVPHIPTVQARLGIGPGMLGLALLSCAAGALVAMPLAGILIARWGSRKVTLGSALPFCLMAVLPVQSSRLSLLILALFAFGAVNGTMNVAMNAHGVTVAKRLDRPIMSSLHAFFSIGGLVGASGSILFLSVGFTPLLHMCGAIMLGLLLVGGVWRFLLPSSTDSTERTGPTFALPRGPLLLLGLMGFFALMVEGAMGDWSAVYLRGMLKAGTGLAGIGFTLFSMAMAVGRLTGDRLVIALGPVRLLRVGGTLATCGLVALGIALPLHHPAAALVGFGCVGLGLSNINPLLYLAAGRTPGLAPGTSISAVITAGYGGILAGPPLVGFVTHRMGMPVALGLLAIFLAFIAVSASYVRSLSPSKAVLST
ncbi:Predicted arabinose efflux permease, MFS family [Stigmatella aurantiaca]|uniref:Predicted arabinose efflux permease, MFS family n=1 Tax=Stigmatella aurantiaca TaxID=41 RepID=A0A1H7QDE6_STIAU|nr:MFS transporter [Stigmatella aurantiaca]SEL46151.1 Predicted arabinose efflux permease, MFS family [Stigmatella aurantiaca]